MPSNSKPDALADASTADSRGPAGARRGVLGQQASKLWRSSTMMSLGRNRAFVLVLTGQTVSQVGNGVYQLALGWTVYSITGSARDMGAVLAVNMVTRLAFMLLGGVLADRLSRRLIILSSDLTAGVVILGLAVLAQAHRLGFAELLTASAVLGVCSAMYGPAYRAVIPDIVPADHYAAANSVVTVFTNAARLVGPVTGGLLYAVGGTGAAFGFDGGSFLFACVAMIFTPFPRRQVPYTSTVRRDLVAGVRYCVQTPWLRFTTTLSLALNLLAIAPFLVLIPAVVRRTGGGAGGLGAVLAIQVAASSVTAMWLARRSANRRPAVALATLAGCLGAGVVIVGLARNLAEVAAGAALVGVGFAFDIVESNMMFARVPKDMISKAFSFNLLVSFGATPIGYIAAGFLQGAIGTTGVLVTGAGALMALALAALVVLARRYSAGPAAMPDG